jgi:hypothetical protein
MKWIVFALLTLLIYLKLNYAKIKGVIGEKRVIKQLQKLPTEDYKVINDITIVHESGSSQIDHIVLSPYGVFVIETKNYTGWIHGSDKSEYWVQTIYKSKNEFRNPIRQNWGHICALKEILQEYEDNIFISIIVFAGDAEFKNVNTRTDVIYDFELYETIMKHRGIPKLSQENIEAIHKTILNIITNDKKVKKKHVKDIKKNIVDKKIKDKSLICPKCNGNLIVKEGKYGRFYGCSNYPNCRYTRRIN